MRAISLTLLLAFSCVLYADTPAAKITHPPECSTVVLDLQQDVLGLQSEVIAYTATTDELLHMSLELAELKDPKVMAIMKPHILAVHQTLHTVAGDR